MTATTSLSTKTALYNRFDIAYNQEMSGPYTDLSVNDGNGKIIAGVKDGQVTGFWRPMLSSGTGLKKYIKRLYDTCPNITYMDFLEDGCLSEVSLFLLQRGYKARPYFTQVIDLTQSIEQLHADLRKSYKSLVNKSAITSIMGDIEPYKRLHITVRGEQTRSDETWCIQQRMIWENRAFCLLQSEVVSPVLAISLAGGLFYYNNSCCYYASGTFSEGIDGHSLIWQAILHAKKLGCKTFEMGEQVFNGDEKLEGISKFKRGFGGRTETRLLIEKEENEDIDIVG